MSILRLIIPSLIITFSQVGSTQSTILNMLYLESTKVFKAKVKSYSIYWSNDAGIEYTVQLEVEKYYKTTRNNRLEGRHPEKVLTYVWNRQIIFPKIDTVFMDWTRWMAVDSSYIFFTENWEEVKRIKDYQSAKLTHSRFEGIPFCSELEHTLAKFKHSNGISNDHERRNHKTLELIKNNSDTIITAKVKRIKKKKEYFEIKIEEDGEDKTLLTKTKHCLSPNGQLEKDESYVFYLRRDMKGNYILVDEWLGAILASEREKFLKRLGIITPY